MTIVLGYTKIDFLSLFIVNNRDLLHYERLSMQLVEELSRILNIYQKFTLK